MDFDDFFDDYVKKMRNRFKKMFTFDDDFFNYDFFKDELNEQFKIDYNRAKKGDPSNKSYSISYRYDSSMKEPQIRVEGDVDDEIVKQRF